MAQIIKSLSLDVSRQNRVRAILAKQYDNDSRFLNVQLNNEGEPIVVAPTSTVLINATRADGESESFTGCVNDDGSVTVPITYWMLEVPGRVKCDISVISEQGSKLSSLSFSIEVEKTNGVGESIGEQENCGILVQLISEVKQLEDNFKTVFIRYSASADGENYSETWSEGMEYIGIANTDTEPVDKSGYVWCRFALSAEGNSITVDSELSLESENPVQNKAVTQEFKAFNEAVGEINKRVSSLESGGVGGGGVSSWNDLTDKPFYEEVGTIFESEIQYELADDDGDGVMDMWWPAYIEDTSDSTLKIGKTYTLTWDGVEYECECSGFGGVSGIGNTDFMNGKDNGCPVIIVRDITGVELGAPGWMVMLVYNRDDLTGSGLHTCKIEGGIIKQLDNKYLEPFEGIVAEDLLPSVTGTTELYEDLGVYAAFSKTTEEMFNRWNGNSDNAITGNIFVEFDGVTYECTPQVLTAMDNAVAVGNCTNFGGTDNGEPFVITIIIDNYTDENNNVIDTYSWAIAALTDTASTEHQYRVYQPYDEPKYLLKEDHLPFDAIAAYIDNYIDEALGGDY